METFEEYGGKCFHGHDMIYGMGRYFPDPLQDGNPCIVAGCEQMDPGVERGGGDLVIGAYFSDCALSEQISLQDTKYECDGIRAERYQDIRQDSMGMLAG